MLAKERTFNSSTADKLLQYLVTIDRPVSMSAARAELGIDHSTMTVLVEWLEEHGLLDTIRPPGRLYLKPKNDMEASI